MPYWLKQLLPLRYEGRVGLPNPDGNGDVTWHNVTWRQWFGRVFRQRMTPA